MLLGTADDRAIPSFASACIKGSYSQTIHYKDGVKVGESCLGLFGDSQKHYDAADKYLGYSISSSQR